MKQLTTRLVCGTWTFCLVLLGSPPDTVHSVALRRTE